MKREGQGVWYDEVIVVSYGECVEEGGGKEGGCFDSEMQ